MKKSFLLVVYFLLDLYSGDR